MSEDGVRDATIVIVDERIEAITTPEATPAADETIDATGLHVFPGVVDPHSHLNDPGNTESEDFYTGTCAAAAGGVTTVIEMPQTVPIVVDRERFRDKRAIAESKAVVDFALWGAVTAENVGEHESRPLQEMAAEGAIAFKAFTSDSPEQPRIPDVQLVRALRQASDLGLFVGVHCEDQPLIDFYAAQLRREGRNDCLIGADSRLAIAEIEAARRVIVMAELTRARVHLAHVSHPATFDLVREARARGVRVTAETCPHYLELTRDDIARIGSFAMCNPPIRDDEARTGLWTRLADGFIDAIGSDHCVYTDEEKANPDFWSMVAGIHGMQMMFPLVVGEAARHGVSLSMLAKVFSGNVARIFGLHPRKGSLQPGSDADLTMVDLDAPWRVRREALLSKATGTAYEGHEVRASVRRTLVRGRTVFEAGSGPRGSILVEPGSGRFQQPLRSLPPVEAALT